MVKDFSTQFSPFYLHTSALLKFIGYSVLYIHICSTAKTGHNNVFTATRFFADEYILLSEIFNSNFL